MTPRLSFKINLDPTKRVFAASYWHRPPRILPISTFFTM